MTNNDRLKQLRKERFERWEKQVKTYQDLLEYWTSRTRVIANSYRLNQSVEFIAEQAANAAKCLAHLHNNNVA